MLAAAARLIEALRGPMWFDEIYTLWIARLGPAGVLHALSHDVHPPLHEWLVWGWWRMGGESALWLRSLSILFGVATVAALYGLTRDLFGRAPALLAALLLALHRTHVYFSQELRSYALLWLLETLAAWAAWRFVRSGSLRSGATYALAATAALYTHYQSGLVLLFLGLWGAASLVRSPRRVAGWLALHVLIAAAFAPQIPTFLVQLRQQRELHWVTAPTPHDLIVLLRTWAFGFPLLIVPALALAILPLARKGERAAAALLVSFTLPAIAWSFAATQHGGHFFTERYMNFALPAWCALLAAGVLGLRWKPVASLGALGLAIAAAYSLARHQPLEEPRALDLAARAIASGVKPGDVIVHADTHSLLFFMQNAPGLARNRLLVVGPPLPYYEGTAVIPDSVWISAAEFTRLRESGTRWWGVQTHHAGFDSGPALDTLRTHAGSIRHFGTLVTVIEGEREASR